MLGEKTLIGLLSDLDAVEVLARELTNLEIIPNEDMRQVAQWSLDYYRESLKAPTVQVLKERWGDTLTDNDIDLDDPPQESIEWAIEALKASYVSKRGGEFMRKMLTDMGQCAPEERVQMMADFSAKLSVLSLSLQSRTTQVDLRESGDRILTAYDEAVANQGQVRGLGFGLPEIDMHTGGIHDGEIAIVAGYAKTGKSYFMDFVAYQNWSQRGLSPALFTLENSIEMTEMRIACIALHLSINEMQDGTLSSQDYESLRAWCTDVLHAASNPLHIFNPSTVQRTPHAIVAAARANNADMIILDQLTFVDNTEVKKDQNRAYELVDILQDLKGLISTGRHRMPLLVAHQITREGNKTADSTGQLLMRHMADSSAVERTADWAFALYQTEDERDSHLMQFQGLGSRRKANRSFNLLWHIEVGMVGVRNPMPLSDETPAEVVETTAIIETLPTVESSVTVTPVTPVIPEVIIKPREDPGDDFVLQAF